MSKLLVVSGNQVYERVVVGFKQAHNREVGGYIHLISDCPDCEEMTAEPRVG